MIIGSCALFKPHIWRTVLRALLLLQLRELVFEPREIELEGGASSGVWPTGLTHNLCPSRRVALALNQRARWVPAHQPPWRCLKMGFP